MSVRHDSVINIFEYQDESFVKGREGWIKNPLISS